MKYRSKSVLLWILASLVMLSAAVYQRLTGPTHPKRGNISIEGENVRYKLVRTWEVGSAAEVRIKTTKKNIEGKYRFKRFKSFDEWSEKPLNYRDGELVATLPELPAAGKVEYIIFLKDNDRYEQLEPEPLILRYKGRVPDFVLIPHIFFMFFAMLFSTRTGFEAVIHGKNLRNYTTITLIFLTIGGMFLGPVVQKYAFDAFWTGWPFGKDLTDNKTLAGFIFWLVAWLQIRKNPNKIAWVIIASIVLFAIYMIPHSMFGSEIDFRHEAVN
jgi:hypothetical protein